MAISRLLLSRLRCACWHQYNNLAPRYSKKFTEYRFYATTVKLKIDSQNIVSSGLPDIKNFENVYLHNLIWDKYVRWSDKIALVCIIDVYLFIRNVCRYQYIINQAHNCASLIFCYLFLYNYLLHDSYQV